MKWFNPVLEARPSLLAIIAALLVGIFAIGRMPGAHAQMIWRQGFGGGSIVLFKEVDTERYYCTWAIAFGDADKAGFVFQADRPLVLWIFWKMDDPPSGVAIGLYMQAMLDGVNYPFTIQSVDFNKPMKSVEGTFGGILPRRTPDQFWKALSGAKSFRLYLPNGQFREADTAAFSDSARRLEECLTEAESLNKSVAKRLRSR
jgi:hypothetical protein